MKIQLKWACRIEHLGSGFYSSLSNQYRKNREVSNTLEIFAKDEYRHGVMFGRAFQDEFGKKIMAGPWRICGRIMAFSQYLIPLRWKLKSLSHLESLALTQMNRELRSEKPNRYRTILKKIQADEQRHSAFYSSLYPATGGETAV